MVAGYLFSLVLVVVLGCLTLGRLKRRMIGANANLLAEVLETLDPIHDRQ